MNIPEVELEAQDDNNIKLYTIADIQKMLHRDKNKTYKVMQLRGVPTIQIGERILVPHNQLCQWINQNISNKIEV